MPVMCPASGPDGPGPYLPPAGPYSKCLFPMVLKFAFIVELVQAKPWVCLRCSSRRGGATAPLGAETPYNPAGSRLLSPQAFTHLAPKTAAFNQDRTLGTRD